MEESIAFCQAHADDADALVALRIEAMRESLERAGRFDAARARQRFLSGFSPEHTRHIVLGERHGFVLVDEAEFDNCYVRAPGADRALHHASPDFPRR